MSLEARAHLPQGPPPLMVEVRFSQRELEFIALRYGQEKTHKEIAAALHVTERTSKWYGETITKKLGIFKMGEGGSALIKVTKMLIKHKIISAD